MKTVYQLYKHGGHKSWNQGASAKTIDGTPTEPWDKHATSFCLLGATRRIYGSNFQGDDPAHLPKPKWHPVNKARSKLASLIGPYPHARATTVVAQWNDTPHRTFKDVITLVKQAEI